MFTHLGLFIVRRTRLVLLLSAVIAVAAMALAGTAFGKLENGGFTPDNAESTRAQQLIDQHLDGNPNLLLLIDTRSGNVDDPAVVAAADRLTTALGQRPEIRNIQSYWTTGAATLKSQDARYGLISAFVSGDETASAKTVAAVVKDDLGKAGTAVTVRAAGALAVNNDIDTAVMEGLVLAESIALPLTLILLLAIFGSVMSAVLPLVIALLAIAGTFAELSLLAEVTPVSIFATNLITALALGLAIDYALLTVSRFREELARGISTEDAVSNTIRTAGRTIVFSATTVAAALSAVLVFNPPSCAHSHWRASASRSSPPQRPRSSCQHCWPSSDRVSTPGEFLRTQHAIAALANLGQARGRRHAASGGHRHSGAGHPAAGRRADSAHRIRDGRRSFPADHHGQPYRPRCAAHRVRRGQHRDHGHCHHRTGLHRVHRALRETTLDAARGEPSRQSRRGFAAGKVTGLSQRRLTASGAQEIVLTLNADIHPESATAQDLVRAVRATPTPDAMRFLVGGTTATLVDTKHAIATRLPWALLLLTVTTFIVLFLFTGSVVQPLRALLLNLIGLSATFGVMILIFQQGHGSGLLDITPRPLDLSMPVLLLCIAFGLSMDYEVFLISRIKELHDAGADTREAVIEGLGRTGRIISAAAILIAISFFAFAVSPVSFAKFFGLAAGVAVLLDATVMRGILVPVSFRLLGERAWYAPQFLKRLHRRVGVYETDPGVRRTAKIEAS